MRILACVKRVPAPGARILLSADGREIETAHLGFAISPHEECAVEEAIQIVEREEGSVTVLTLGPAEAEEQLRYAVSVGADAAVLVETDGSDWDPQATARAITAAIVELEAEQGLFDLLLFGNESADSGGYQVGIRVAYALNRPIVSGVKQIDVEPGRIVSKRETDGGQEVYELALPAVVAVKEGINLPRYPTLQGRLRSKKAQLRIVEPRHDPGGQSMVRLRPPPEQLSETEILGTGPAAAPRVVELLEELGIA